MATSNKTAPEAEKEPIPVEGLEVKGGKVVAVAPEPEIIGEAQPTPDKPAEAPPKDEKVVANIGVLRVETTQEKRIEEATGNAEANALRDPKQAHAEAAGLSVIATPGTELRTDDIRTDDYAPVRSRLLFDWFDGQGVFHPRGKIMDLPRNEAMKLIGDGRAERANPPDLPPVEKAVAEATLKALQAG